uniref:Pre-rRNA-processing protein TSR2 homolog n=1 Tax=Polytomella parva TaxID=51329 RepID=A0A7S0Y8A4_9CHLO|mmetsp:Transcript_13371/g.23678  ORF Transcript_13371/g.23678 Transcript_13371/m.23678 type:complete len:207 (+) Transcript_13371:13-633(+)
MQLRSGYRVGQNVMAPEHRPLFEEGVALIFAKWTALRLAVDNKWGGDNSEEKAQFLMEDIIDWFYKQRDHFTDDLEVELDEAILHDFNVEAEDGSPKQVSQALIQLYQEVQKGQMDMLEHLRRLEAEGAKKSKKQVMDLDGTIMEAGIDDMKDSSSDDEGSDAEMGDVAMEADEAPLAIPIAEPEIKAPIVDEDGFTMIQKGRRRR